MLSDMLSRICSPGLSDMVYTMLPPYLPMWLLMYNRIPVLCVCLGIPGSCCTLIVTWADRGATLYTPYLSTYQQLVQHHLSYYCINIQYTKECIYTGCSRWCTLMLTQAREEPLYDISSGALENMSYKGMSHILTQAQDATVLGNRWSASSAS